MTARQVSSQATCEDPSWTAWQSHPGPLLRPVLSSLANPFVTCAVGLFPVPPSETRLRLPDQPRPLITRQPRPTCSANLISRFPSWRPSEFPSGRPFRRPSECPSGFPSGSPSGYLAKLQLWELRRRCCYLNVVRRNLSSGYPEKLLLHFGHEKKLLMQNGR